ncbi:hypothetical protein L6472_02650 [Prevotella sp. E13-17]|uniref:hypothetical protein n=1 Tax=Prevotella sp. E13-17 TaxID=2913616 RepID=UPI001EDBB1AA|nr:hypothetical protein [Prevotella sp. E13-17]UKK51510.1 hypothetical protein L6472_02650 [Prevotella sp. E13-17]
MIDVILYTIYILLAVGIGLALWSALRHVRVTPLMLGVAAGMLIILTLTYFLADTTPLTINGRTFDDEFWLRVSDMLIWTSVVLMLIAVLGVVISATGLGRKLK